jgi:anaerobic magnesium-protoporphyrin IX monomethyl ester cyclase
MKKNKIILIYPDIDKTGKIIIDIPIGLLMLSAPLLDQGYDVSIIDMRLNPHWKNTLKKSIDKYVLYVGISVMTGTPIKYALQASQLVKQISSITTVWGGIHPTLLPKQTLENADIDIVAIGENEQIALWLAQALVNNQPLSSVKGIAYKDSAGITIVNEPSGKSAYFDSLRLPYYLLDMPQYYRRGNVKKILPILTSRGCPHNCSFCYVSGKQEKGWQAWSVEKVMLELTYLIDHFHPGIIYFLDDEFFININRAEKILSEIRKRNWPIDFHFRGIRVDSILRLSNNSLKILEEIGASMLLIGAESGSDEMLKIMNKKITSSMTIKANLKLSKHPKLKPTYNFFSGLPGETIKDVKQSVKLCLTLLNDNPSAALSVFNQFIPWPGSDLFISSKTSGFVAPNSLSAWITMGPDNMKGNAPWVSKNMQSTLNMLFVCSYFVDDKLMMHFSKKTLGYGFLKLLIRLYQPIAKYRFKHTNTAFPLDIILFKWLINLRFNS